MEMEMIITSVPNLEAVPSTDHEIRVAKMTRIKDRWFTYLVHSSFPTYLEDLIPMASKHSAKTTSHFEQALLYTTSIKLGEVEKQRLAYHAHFQIIEEANKLPENKDNLIKKVELLAEVVRSWSGPGTLTGSVVGEKLDLNNLKCWMEQARHDPSFNVELIKGWAETLETHIQQTNRRFDYAKLFQLLCNEWAESRDSSALAYEGIGEPNEGWDRISDGELEYVTVEKEDVPTQKETPLSMIFEDHPMDVDQLTAYLEDLFATEEAAKALAKVRNSLHSFGFSFQRTPLAGLTVKCAITGLLASASMNEEQRVALTEFQKNEKVLQEIASALNMRLANLESWSWPKEGIPVEIRRHMNDNGLVFLRNYYCFQSNSLFNPLQSVLGPRTNQRYFSAIRCDPLAETAQVCTPRPF